MLVAFSVAPVGVGESVSEAVADAVRVVRESGLPHQTDAMFTTIEGEWAEVFEVIRLATEAVARHSGRVSLVMKADIRTGFSGELTAKMVRLEAAVTAAEMLDSTEPDVLKRSDTDHPSAVA